jgi:hypothetical protein
VVALDEKALESSGRLKHTAVLSTFPQWVFHKRLALADEVLNPGHHLGLENLPLLHLWPRQLLCRPQVGLDETDAWPLF